MDLLLDSVTDVMLAVR
ncbi:hypothetical protein ACRAWC_02280 [Leifsonia sp. L25]